ncbi:MAG: cyclic nucleotide-binding domain-containing protein [Archangium sp.]|nr:cyclic nucleotide-binding domain-containing protein [Archangium sp.]
MTQLRSQKDRATQLLQKGKLTAALDEFRQALQAEPGDQSVRQKVAEILAHQGRVDEAVEVYAEAVRRYAEQGHFFKAVALSRVILALEPTHQLALQLLAELYASRQGVALPKSPIPRVQGTGSAPQASPPRSASSPIPLAYVQLVKAAPVQAPAPTPAGLPAPQGELPLIPLFSSLTPEEFVAVLAGAVEARTFPPQKPIITEGEPGGAMYAIAQGVVSVWRGGQRVAELEEGAFFGEMALLSGASRMASVVAETEVVVLEFAREKMDDIIARYPGVLAGLEQFFRERLLVNLVRANPLLQPLTDPERAQLAAAFHSCGYAANEVVVEEGGVGEGVFLLLRGSCTTSHLAPGECACPDLVEGDAFGELAALTEVTAPLRVMARSPVQALRIAAGDFRSIVMANPEVNRRVRQLAGERLTRQAQLELMAHPA